MELSQDLQRYEHLWDHKATLRTSHGLKRRGQQGKGREHRRVQGRSETAKIQARGAEICLPMGSVAKTLWPFLIQMPGAGVRAGQGGKDWPESVCALTRNTMEVFQVSNPGLKRLTSFTSCFLEYLILEPSYPAVRKFRPPIERNQGPRPQPQLISLSTGSTDLPAMSEPSWKWTLQPQMTTLASSMWSRGKVPQWALNS